LLFACKYLSAGLTPFNAYRIFNDLAPCDDLMQQDGALHLGADSLNQGKRVTKKVLVCSDESYCESIDFQHEYSFGVLIHDKP
jgi:hypothetical protein